MSERYDAERLQGKLIASGKEDVWGWSGRGRQDPRGASRGVADRSRLGSPGVRCLELGCGTGEFTERLVEAGCELVAVDLSETRPRSRASASATGRESWSGTSRRARDSKDSSSTRSSG